MTHAASEEKEQSFFAMLRFALIVLIIVLPIRFFVAQPFIVSGASMEHTFAHNDYLIIDRLSYRFAEPTRGDVVVFRYPRDPSQFFIKRIVGLPGETVQIDSGTVTIETATGTVRLAEPYTSSRAEESLSVTLRDDEFFVLGDNRQQSSDSRTWGPLHEDEIIGRVLVRLFPFSDLAFRPGAAAVNLETISANQTSPLTE